MYSRKKWILVSVLSASFLSIILTFLINLDAPPVSALEIPQSTIDFLKKMGDLGHVKFDYVDIFDGDDFNNNKDYSRDFKKLEDENFIVYYRDNSKEQSRARKTLQYANESIAPLADFFGKYYYAKDVKNRKLPIYLAVSKSDFANISNQVGGSSVEWAAGLTFTSYSSNGDKLCKGIILNAAVRDDGNTDLRTVVFHEMAHYNHFQCMNLLEKTEYMNWEVEGLASYFANDWNKTIPPRANLTDYSLMSDPPNYSDAYWMGYHAFSLANDMGSLQKILQNSYSKSLIEVIPNHVGCSMSQYNAKWRKHCSKFQKTQ
jgi:hypothetical protein